METHLYPFQKISLLLVITTTICLFHVQNSSAADDDRYLNCSASFQCANFRDVPYPFWGSSRPDYCGFPDFKLNCSGDAPVISFEGQDYRVLDINQSTSTLRVARTDFWNNLCPVSLANTTIKSSHIENTSDAQGVLLFYDCPPIFIPLPNQPTGQFNCSVNSRTTSINYFVTNLELPNISGYCNTTVTARVSQSAAADLGLNSSKDNLVAALDSGFGLKWDASNTLCGQCQVSGGQCGYNISSAEFTCFCKDGPNPARCEESSMIIIVGTLGSVAFCSLVVVVAGCFFRKRLRTVKERYHSKRQKKKVGNDTKKTVESLQFRLGTIETATNKFSDDNKLGEGGFGAVFKGTLGNGHEIAVKRLSKSSTQGVQEFQNEVVLVAKLQHRNLVRLLGFCLEGEETLLVYEYVPNKSFDKFLFEPKKREQLDWSRRCMIIGGIARGILYLHEDSRLKVIHRDLKASNILLDGEMNPKISDFGMAKMFGVDGQTQGNTERVVGT